MSPPTFANLGKQARDIFDTGYNYGTFNLRLKTKSTSGVQYISGGSSNFETGVVTGNMETKFTIPDYGVTFSEKWCTNNTFMTEVSSTDALMKGLKVGLECMYFPKTGYKNGKVKVEFQHDVLAVNVDTDLKVLGPVVNASAVGGFQDFLLGFRVGYDTENMAFTKNSVALGYTMGDMVFHTNIDNGQDFCGSVFHRCSKELSTGVQLNWSSQSSATKFAISGSYQLDGDATLRAKINTDQHIGLGYEHKVRPGIAVTVSARVNGNNFNTGGHKFGLGLDFET